MKKQQRIYLIVDKLLPHPLQSVYYPTCTAADDAELCESLRREGQRDAIVVMPPDNKAGLPAYTILDGHRRRQFLQEIGAKKVLVNVRWDLLDAESSTVERAFLDFNDLRRHESPLARARKALRRYELEIGKAPGGIRHSCHEHEAKSRIGEQFGWTQRHLNRMFRILLTPAEVQQAVDRRDLPMLMAEKVEGLDDAVQKEIARRLYDLPDPTQAKQIVAEYVTGRSGRHRQTSDAFEACIKSITAILRDLGDRADQVYRYDALENEEILRQFREVIDVLLASAQEAREAGPRRSIEQLASGIQAKLQMTR